MFANTAADTKVRVHMGELEPHLNFNFTSRSSMQRLIVGDGHAVAGVCRNSETLFSMPISGLDVIVTCGELARLQIALSKFQSLLISFQNGKDTTSDRAEMFSGKDCLRAHRAVLLADNTWPVHGPWQTATPINKSRSQADRTRLGVFFSTKFFFQGYRPDCRAGTDV